MKVLIDAKELCARGTGLARYEREIAARVSQPGSTVLVVRRQAIDDGSASALSGRIVVVPNGWPSVVIEQLVMSLLSWQYRASTVHALAGRLPLIARRGHRVVTFHEDRNDYYEQFPARGFYMRCAARVQMYIERRSVARADRVLAISGVSAAAAVSLGAEPTRVEVSHHGVSDAFRPSAGEGGMEKATSAQVLVLASRDPRDDLQYVLQAVTPLRQRLGVTIVGRLPEASIQTLGGEALRLGVRMRFLGEVSDEQLAALYSQCLSYLHPSAFEGFGLAILEAMACGAPVIARPSPALAEVAAQTATVAPSPTDATKALLELLDRPELRIALSSAGQQRARLFTWEAAARVTLAAYQ